jgi:glycosyltransferase involved in cell wall biosynthesis
MNLSVLIATLENRRDKFKYISERLASQVTAESAEEMVEVLSERDNGEQPLGAKRNALIQRACGRFVTFVDDDDDVGDDYISKICEVISRRNDIDCIGIKGIITFRGGHPREFSHSVKYRDYFSCRHSYFRPPYHLNPILRAIALKFPFRAVSYSEDVEWALRIQRAGVLQREEFIDTPLYFYKSRRWWNYQLLVDWSEPLRHALGLRMVNRLLLSAPPPSAK